MLRYYDKDGSPIQKATWWDHLLDPAYGILHHHTGDGWEVTAEWLGIASLREQKPGLFLVRVWDFVADSLNPKPSTRRKVRDKVVWTQTAQEAIEEAEAIIMELSGEET